MAKAVRSVPVRGMATEQQLQARLKSVKSIQKITKAMKMVAASKLRQVESRLAGARAFAKGITETWKEKPAAEIEGAETKKILVVPMSSDRGLCGGVNTAVVKAVKEISARETANGKEIEIVVVGDKAKSGLERVYGHHIRSTLQDIQKKPASFLEASLVAEYILANDFDEMVLFYNKYVSAIAYDTEPVKFQSLKVITNENNDAWQGFNFEGQKDDILEDLNEFRLASRLYHFFYESATSEQSARMTAMDNSSKNAGEMIDKLQLLYNRSRQARITTELIEIISGAAAAEEQTKSK